MWSTTGLRAVADRTEMGRGLGLWRYLLWSRQTGSTSGPCELKISPSRPGDESGRVERASKVFRNLESLSPSSSLLPLRPGTEAKRNVTGPPRLHQPGPD